MSEIQVGQQPDFCCDQFTADCPWFVERMMNDCWSFALKMMDGSLIGISTITNVKKWGGHYWADVELLDGHQAYWFPDNADMLVAPTSRLTATINLSHVVAAFELADT